MAKLEIHEKDGKIFCPLKDAWHIAKPEERIRQQWICKLVNQYGYSLDQMAQELRVNNSKRGQGKARADIVIWKSKQKSRLRILFKDRPGKKSVRSFILSLYIWTTFNASHVSIGSLRKTIIIFCIRSEYCK